MGTRGPSRGRSDVQPSAVSSKVKLRRDVRATSLRWALARRGGRGGVRLGPLTLRWVRGASAASGEARHAGATVWSLRVSVGPSVVGDSAGPGCPGPGEGGREAFGAGICVTLTATMASPVCARVRTSQGGHCERLQFI